MSSPVDILFHFTDADPHFLESIATPRHNIFTKHATVSVIFT